MSEVVIEDVGADAMQIFLEFIYGRDTSISDFDTACSVLAVADKYDVPGLLRSVRLFLYAYIVHSLQADYKNQQCRIFCHT